MATRPHRALADEFTSRFENAVGRVARGALPGKRLLQSLDFAREQRNAIGQFLDRQERQVLPNLVAQLLLRSIIVLDRHLVLPFVPRFDVMRLPAKVGLANQDRLTL